MKLTEKERLSFIYQLRILEALYPDDAPYYARHRVAIEEGYALHYDWMTEHLFDELSEDQCREVLSILDMYRAIYDAVTRLEAGDPLAAHHLSKFSGFDGNNESHLMSYVRYYVVDLERYSEFAVGEYPGFNSHCPMLDTYRRMLARWGEFDRSFRLTKDQLAHVLGAD